MIKRDTIGVLVKNRPKKCQVLFEWPQLPQYAVCMLIETVKESFIMNAYEGLLGIRTIAQKLKYTGCSKTLWPN